MDGNLRRRDGDRVTVAERRNKMIKVDFYRDTSHSTKWGIEAWRHSRMIVIWLGVFVLTFRLYG